MPKISYSNCIIEVCTAQPKLKLTFPVTLLQLTTTHLKYELTYPPQIFLFIILPKSPFPTGT